MLKFIKVAAASVVIWAGAASLSYVCVRAGCEYLDRLSADRDDARKVRMLELARKGDYAFRCGVPADANPYVASEWRVAWLEGWLAAKVESEADKRLQAEAPHE